MLPVELLLMGFGRAGGYRRDPEIVAFRRTGTFMLGACVLVLCLMAPVLAAAADDATVSSGSLSEVLARHVDAGLAVDPETSAPRTNQKDVVAGVEQILRRHRFLDTTEENLQDLSDAAALGRFDIAAAALFVTANSGSHPELERELFESLGQVQRSLESRRLMNSERVGTLHALLMKSRRFAEANGLRTSHAALSLEPAPEIAQSLSSVTGSVGSVGPDGSYTLESRSIPHGRWIIVTVLPGCQFVRPAAEAIRADQQLAPLFAMHSNWLAVPHTTLSLDRVSAWNRSFPEFRMDVMHRAEGWTMLPDLRLSPAIHLLSDGKLVDVLYGWDEETGLDRLRERLQANGFLDGKP